MAPRLMRQLRFKIVVGVLTLGLVLFACFRMIVVPLVEVALRDQEADRARLYATMVAHALGRDARGSFLELERIARLPEVVAMQRERADPILTSLDATTTYFIHFALFDPAGIVVSRPDKPGRVGADRSDDRHVDGALRTGRTFLGPVRISPGGNLSVTVATPVRRAGTIVGILAGSLGLPDRNPEIYRDIVEPPLPPGWNVWLVSAEGAVIARSGMPAPDPSAGVVDGSTHPSVAAALAGRRGAFEFELGGRRWIAGSAPVESLSWYVVAEVPSSVVDQAVAAATGRLALIGFVAIAGLVGLGLLVVAPLTWRLGRLTSALAAYGAGVDEGVDAGGGDEVGDALRAFNGMVDERRRAEQEREALIAELKQRNTEMGRFTYTVSHDLKSPLITIGGFARLAAEDLEAGDRDRVVRDLAQITTATEKMAQLLTQLLELSRVGRVVTAPVSTALSVIAEEVAAEIKARPGGERVEFVIDRGLPAVMADRSRLVEVVQNLVENAVRFMGQQARPRVEIGMRVDGEKRIFFVADNGTGIAPGHQERIFGLFERLDQDIEGTGIGLALVKRIVEAHDGEVWVESEGAGTGARFCFTLGRRR